MFLGLLFVITQTGMLNVVVEKWYKQSQNSVNEKARQTTRDQSING